MKNRNSLLKDVICIILLFVSLYIMTFVGQKINNQSSFFFTTKYNRLVSFSSISIDCIVAVLCLIISLILVNFQNLFSLILAIINNSYCILFSGYFLFGQFANFDFFPSIIIPILGYVQIFLLKLYMIRAKKNESELRKLSMSDQLTGIGNRRSLYIELKNLIDENIKFYLTFFDLDNFKIVNDVLGHNTGDDLIKKVSSLWTNKKDSKIFRLGGDEFALIINTEKEDIAKDIVMNCLNDVKNDEFINSLNCNVTSSAGIVCYPDNANSIESLLTYADTAMYKAKNSGKNNYVMFSGDIYSEIVNKRDIEDNIIYALNNEKIYMVYQPQFDMNHKLIGFEALARMLDKKNKIISPEKFITIAEESTLILDIDNYILNHVCEDIKKYKILQDNKVSINISSKHFINLDFASFIVKKSKEINANLLNIEIELTETSLVKSFDKTLKAINILNEAGIKVALDDFGTGYSSLSYLYNLPFDTIKIDKKFIDKITSNKKQYQIVKSIISIAHTFDIKVICEGIENQNQLNALKNLKNDYIQGYIWGQPSKAENLELFFGGFK